MKRFIDTIIYPLVLLLAAFGLVTLGGGLALGYALEHDYLLKKPDEEVSEEKE